MAEAGKEAKEELDVICDFPGFKKANQAAMGRVQRGVNYVKGMTGLGKGDDDHEKVSISKERLDAFSKALDLSTKAERLCTVFDVVEMFKLNGCKQSQDYIELKELYSTKLISEKRRNLLFTEVPEVLQTLDQLMHGC